MANYTQKPTPGPARGGPRTPGGLKKGPTMAEQVRRKAMNVSKKVAKR